ncbi:hypothetical protein M9194_09265 [Vibrio sp. S4M6]|uniref:hypothetical protein n=1 Tax=Vibrio sinus TaxID=2946865 RepID=UPI00202A9035|nr:hypothetical protein [Vibrio sinus]MCL9781613.1 hypothetical protein [Vibrio sinus]
MKYNFLITVSLLSISLVVAASDSFASSDEELKQSLPSITTKPLYPAVPDTRPMPIQPVVPDTRPMPIQPVVPDTRPMPFHPQSPNVKPLYPTVDTKPFYPKQDIIGKIQALEPNTKSDKVCNQSTVDQVQNEPNYHYSNGNTPYYNHSLKYYQKFNIHDGEPIDWIENSWREEFFDGGVSFSYGCYSLTYDADHTQPVNWLPDGDGMIDSGNSDFAFYVDAEPGGRLRRGSCYPGAAQAGTTQVDDASRCELKMKYTLHIVRVNNTNDPHDLKWVYVRSKSSIHERPSLWWGPRNGDSNPDPNPEPGNCTVSVDPESMIFDLTEEDFENRSGKRFKDFIIRTGNCSSHYIKFKPPKGGTPELATVTPDGNKSIRLHLRQYKGNDTQSIIFDNEYDEDDGFNMNGDTKLQVEVEKNGELQSGEFNVRFPVYMLPK